MTWDEFIMDHVLKTIRIWDDIMAFQPTPPGPTYPPQK